MQDPPTTPNLRRAWFSGYRPVDVETLLSKFGARVSDLWGEVQALRGTVDELEFERGRLREQLAEVRGRERKLIESSAEQHPDRVLEEARAQALAIVDAAQLDATRIRGEAGLEADTARAQVDELLRMRDTLAGTVRAVVREFESLVGRIDRGDPAPVPRTLHAAPEPAAAPAAPATEAPSANGTTVFDGRVELHVGPFDDFASLSAFERALGSLPKIEDVYIRRFADDRATIDVTLQEPASLIDDMTKRLPYRLDVQQADVDRIAVTLSAFD
jgi:DivIVA protein